MAVWSPDVWASGVWAAGVWAESAATGSGDFSVSLSVAFSGAGAVVPAATGDGDFAVSLTAAFSGTGVLVAIQEATGDGDLGISLAAAFSGSGTSVIQAVAGSGNFASQLSVATSGTGTVIPAVSGAGDFAAQVSAAFAGSGTATVVQAATGSGDFAVALSPALAGTGSLVNAVPVWALHEYVKADATVSLIAAVLAPGPSATLWESTDDGDTWTDISGSLSSTTAKWVFVNLEGKVYATAPGHKIWQYDGTGTFTQIADSPVTSGSLLAAFGRLWAAVDATTQVKYSGLLAGADWTSVSSGTLDASNAFTQGTDTLTALAAFGATLVLFARRQILMYVDGAGSVLGVDPDNLYVVDSIEGTGALEQDTVINIGEGDLWFRSEQGIQSLSRVVQDKVNPKIDISRHIRSLVQDLSTDETGAEGTVKAEYDAKRQLAMFLYPTSEKIVIFDVRAPMDDGTYRSAEWTDQPFFSVLRRRNGDLLFGLTGGEVAKYTGYRDAGTTAFDLVLSTPWTDGGDEAHNRLKILKGLYLDIFGRETLTGKFRWAFDYRPLEFEAAFTSDYASTGAEWGAGEFGEDEFGSGHRSRRKNVGAGGQGRVFKVWFTIESTDVDDFLSIQEIGAFVKLGRAE